MEKTKADRNVACDGFLENVAPPWENSETEEATTYYNQLVYALAVVILRMKKIINAFEKVEDGMETTIAHYIKLINTSHF